MGSIVKFQISSKYTGFNQSAVDVYRNVQLVMH